MERDFSFSIFFASNMKKYAKSKDNKTKLKNLTLKFCSDYCKETKTVIVFVLARTGIYF